MSTVIRPAAPQHPALADSEHYIDEQISRTRRALKLVDFAAGVITAAIGLIVFLLIAAVLDHWVVPGGLNGVGRTALFGVLILAAAWYFWRQFVPLLKPINPVFAAHTIERGSPSLKNSLLNLVLFRTHRQEMSARVYHALERQAAERLSTASVDATVDRSALLRLGYALAAAVAVGALYAVLSPKELGVSAGRVLAPWADLAAPSRVKILDVRPGETSVALGERLAVSAEIHGLTADEPVRLRYSTADEQLVDESIPMTLADVGGRYEAQLPRSTGGQGAVGVQQNLSYWIEAGDARSKQFAVSVFLRPTLVVQRVRYDYPAYTGLPSKEVESTGDISGIEGTRVSISAQSNQPIKLAYVDFNADGRNDVKMTVDGDRAVASFELALRDDRRTPQHGSYVLRLTTTADRTNADPPKYSIDVTPDYPPEVRITSPEEPELEVRVDEIVPISVEAHDPDFALAGVRLVGRAGDREIEMGDLLSERRDGRFGGKKLFTPGDVQLKPGDVLEYWAEARDVRRPEPHVTPSDRRRLRIVGGPNDGAANEGERPQDGTPNEGEQGGGEDGLSGPGGESSGEADGEQSEGEGNAAAGAGKTGGGEENAEQQPGDAGEDAEGQGASADSKDGEGQGAAGGGNEGEQGEGEKTEPSDQRDGGDQGGESGEPGEAAPGEGGGAEPSKVSSAGDNDAEAFDRIAKHLEQEGESQEPREAAGDGKQQGNEGEPRPNERPGADAPRESKLGDGNPGEQQDSERPGDGTMNRNQGDAGSGADGEQPEGPASDGSAKQARDKQDQDNRERMDDQTPPGGSNSKKESDSSGGQSGDKSGGGQSGSGQHADAKGKGAAGQNTAADEGAGAANEQGEGETGPDGGADELADGKTGESSGDRRGEGSKAGAAGKQGERAGASPPSADEGERGDKQDGKQTGDAGQSEDASGQGASSKGSEGEGSPPGDEAQGQDPAKQPGKSGGDSPAGAQDGPQAADAPTKPQPQSPPQQGAEGVAGGNPQGGGQGAADGSSGVPDQLPPDEANLEFARKQTDLVLERLDQQLAKKQVDKNLLKSLGWNEDELRQFVDRWKGLKQEAEEAEGDEARQELDAALRSLGMRPGGPGRYSATSKEDRIRDLNEGVRKQAPQEYQDRVRSYNKGVSTAKP